MKWREKWFSSLVFDPHADRDTAYESFQLFYGWKETESLPPFSRYGHLKRCYGKKRGRQLFWTAFEQEIWPYPFQIPHHGLPYDNENYFLYPPYNTWIMNPDLE